MRFETRSPAEVPLPRKTRSQLITEARQLFEEIVEGRAAGAAAFDWSDRARQWLKSLERLPEGQR